METTIDRDSDVRKWLTVALTGENLENFSVDITGNSEKGDGYAGDIIFVFVTGTDKQGNHKEYDLVLKCSKPSAALLENIPALRLAFVKEAYMYQNVFPIFKEFQVSRGMKRPFDSVPKCYGVYSDEFRLVIVLENLKKLGYDLWPKAKPLSREVINIVIKDYAKFHATSVALQEQHPKKFRKLLEGSPEDVMKEAFKSSGFENMFKNGVEMVHELLTDNVKNDILEKWLKLKDQVYFILGEMEPGVDDLKVINHGDCWVNNFLYKFENEEKTNVSKVAILDWQMSKFTSPVTDLSYFLFTGISDEDIADIETILRDYHKYLCEYLRELNSQVADKYTVEKFFDEWKKYGKFGVLFCVVPIQSLYTEKEDLPDLVEAAGTGKDILESFTFEVKDKNGFKKRLRPIVEYAFENNLI
ncbi:hypothetical protein Zmor_023690 [Zophobas morio]|uniref:CHK kinase-like domain-containing protein n=1 Tax=Zophobas morio TaxID=2755281 RepID=A0AA38I3V1_9CUCU|nr:hypothetical protein Zmor_023690 [Zophobas morio]